MTLTATDQSTLIRCDLNLLSKAMQSSGMYDVLPEYILNLLRLMHSRQQSATFRH